MQGYAMFLLTHFGSPKPWSQEKVELYLMQVRQELSDKNRHAYSRLKRVWAQKPVDTNE